MLVLHKKGSPHSPKPKHASQGDPLTLDVLGEQIGQPNYKCFVCRVMVFAFGSPQRRVL